jgi:hypothetical protein
MGKDESVTLPVESLLNRVLRRDLRPTVRPVPPAEGKAATTTESWRRILRFGEV